MSTPSHESQAMCLTVPLGERSYPIRISSGDTDHFASAIGQTLPDLTHAVIIADQAVEEPWCRILGRFSCWSDRCASCQHDEAFRRVNRASRWQQFERLLQWMLEREAIAGVW